MPSTDADEPILVRYRTPEVRASELELIQKSIGTHGSAGRAAIAERLCEIWEWRPVP